MKINLTTILLIGIAVLLTIQVQSCFGKKSVDEKAIENRIKLEQLQKELPAIKQERDEISAKYDSLIAASNQRYQSLEQKKQPLQYAIKQVPVVVDNFDKEQLRRALSEY